MFKESTKAKIIVWFVRQYGKIIRDFSGITDTKHTMTCLLHQHALIGIKLSNFLITGAMSILNMQYSKLP